MAELEDGTLELEVRMTTNNEDTKAVKKEIQEIAQTGANAGSVIDSAFEKSFREMVNAINSSSEKIVGQMSQIVDTTRTSATSIQEEMHKIQESITGSVDTSVPQQSFEEVERKAKEAGQTIDNDLVKVVEKAKDALKALGVGFTLEQVVTQIARTRGEFQQLEVSFETMLGSEVKASKLMNQLTNTAAHTPFDLKGIADGAKQLLAYGAAADEVNDTLVMLGNISSGLSIPLGDLVYLYGTTMTQGRLFTQDMRQFMGRGIPLAEELSKQFGVAKDEIGKMVTEGKVGFPEVAKALQSMTSEGGQFYNLMEKQSHTINGLISNLGDAVDTMMNEIGKSTEGIFEGALNAAINVVENYKVVGKTFIELASIIGVVKASMIAVNAVQKVNNIYQLESAKAKAVNAAATQKLIIKETAATISTKAWTVAQTKLNAALSKMGLTNPYVAFTAAVVGLSYALYKVVTYQTQYQKMLSEAEKTAKSSAAAADFEINKLKNLKGRLDACTEGTAEYKKIKQEIIDNYSQYDETLKKEGLSYEELSGKVDGLTESIRKSFAERAFSESYEKAASEMSESFGKAADKLHKRLVRKLGAETAGKIEQDIQNALQNGEVHFETAYDGAKQYIKVVGDVSEETKNKIKELTLGYTTYATRLFGDALKDMEETYTKMDTLWSEMRVRFNLDPQKSAKDKLMEGWQSVGGVLQQALNNSEKADNQAEDEQRKKILAARKSFEQEITDAVVNAQIEREQLEIDAMEEGEEKFQRQMKLNADKRENIINQQIEKYKAKNKELYGKEELKPEQTQHIDIMRQNSTLVGMADENKKRDDDKKKFEKDLEERISLYEKYSSEITDIYDQYAEERKKIEDDVSMSDEEQEVKKAKLDERQAKDLSITLASLGITEDSVTRELTDIIISSYTLATETAVDTLQDTIMAMQQQLTTLTQDGVTEENADQIARLKASIVELQKLLAKAKRAEQSVNDEAGKASMTIQQKMSLASQSMAQLNEAISAVREQFGDMFDEVTNDAMDMIQTSLSAAQGVLNSLSATSTGVAASMSTAEKASVILAIIQAAIQVTMAMIKVLTNFTKNAKLQKQIDQLKAEADGLAEAFERAEFAHRKLTGKNAWSQSIRDARLLEQQISKISDALQLAQEKEDNITNARRKAKAHDQVAELEETLRNLMEKEEGIFDEFYNNLFATDAKSYASQLASALVEGWDEGMTDMTATFDDALNDMLKSIVQSQLRADLETIYTDAINEMKKQFQYGKSDVSLQDLEFITRIAEKANEEASQYAEYYKTIYDALNLNTGDLAASVGAIQGMSQDTAEELNGRFTALQMSGASIDLKMDETHRLIRQSNAITSSIATDISLAVSLASDQLGVLEDIRNNTARLAAVERSLNNISSQMSSITGQ